MHKERFCLWLERWRKAVSPPPPLVRGNMKPQVAKRWDLTEQWRTRTFPPPHLTQCPEAWRKGSNRGQESSETVWQVFTRYHKTAQFKFFQNSFKSKARDVNEKGMVQVLVWDSIVIRYTLFRPLLLSHTLVRTHRLSKPIPLIKANLPGPTFDQTYANENIFIRS